MTVELPMKQWGSKMVVNWSVVNGSYQFGESIVEVITNKMVEKIAKVSGNKRKEGRLEVRLNGFEDIYECGTESFKKGSFLKNLIKKSIHKIIETMVKPTNYIPMIYNPIRKNFLGETDQESMDYMFTTLASSNDERDYRTKWKQFAKNYHPDYLRRELFPHEKIMYQVLNETKDFTIRYIKNTNEFIKNAWKDEEVGSKEDIKKDLEDKLNMDLTDEEIEEFIKTVMEY